MSRSWNGLWSTTKKKNKLARHQKRLWTAYRTLDLTHTFSSSPIESVCFIHAQLQMHNWRTEKGVFHTCFTSILLVHIASSTSSNVNFSPRVSLIFQCCLFKFLSEHHPLQRISTKRNINHGRKTESTVWSAYHNSVSLEFVVLVFIEGEALFDPPFNSEHRNSTKKRQMKGNMNELWQL